MCFAAGTLTSVQGTPFRRSSPPELPPPRFAAALTATCTPGGAALRRHRPGAAPWWRRVTAACHACCEAGPAQLGCSVSRGINTPGTQQGWSADALWPTGCGDGSAEDEKGGRRTLLFSMFCTSICRAQHSRTVVTWCAGAGLEHRCRSIYTCWCRHACVSLMMHYPAPQAQHSAA